MTSIQILLFLGMGCVITGAIYYDKSTFLYLLFNVFALIAFISTNFV